MKTYRDSKEPFLSLVIFFFFTSLMGQDTIYLKNPSFEDLPRKGVPGMPPIKQWTDCARSKFIDESPPDIHPVKDNAWEVTMRAMDGNTYLGLVTRYNFSWESVGQQLSPALKGGVCYSFSVHLARSPVHNSPTRRSINKNGSRNPEPFTSPVTLVIWGGKNSCERTESLAVSAPVDHQDWRKYDFVLKPNEDYSYLTLEAYYTIDQPEPYNGHILVDHLSPIIETRCE